MANVFAFIVVFLLLILHPISFYMGEWRKWVSGCLCLVEYKEILLQSTSLMAQFGGVGFMTFREGRSFHWQLCLLPAVTACGSLNKKLSLKR